MAPHHEPLWLTCSGDRNRSSPAQPCTRPRGSIAGCQRGGACMFRRRRDISPFLRHPLLAAREDRPRRPSSVARMHSPLRLSNRPTRRRRSNYQCESAVQDFATTAFGIRHLSFRRSRRRVCRCETCNPPRRGDASVASAPNPAFLRLQPIWNALPWTPAFAGVTCERGVTRQNPTHSLRKHALTSPLSLTGLSSLRLSPD